MRNGLAAFAACGEAVGAKVVVAAGDWRAAAVTPSDKAPAPSAAVETKVLLLTIDIVSFM
jgi:hypothetical protein